MSKYQTAESRRVRRDKRNLLLTKIGVAFLAVVAVVAVALVMK